MPSKSKKQHNLMALVANNPKAAKRLNIPQSVGEEFMKADKGKKFMAGGMAKHEDVKMDKKVVKKAIGMHDKQMHGGKKTSLQGLKKGGKVKKYAAGGDISADDYVEESVRDKMKMDARKKQNEADRKMLEKKYPPKKDVAEDDMPPKDSKGNYIKPRPYKSGGSCSAKKYARGGGIEVRGKTRGKII